MFGVVISPVQFGSGLILFFYFYFHFFYIYIDDKEKINLIASTSHSNIQLFVRIYKYYNKTKPTGISPNIYFIYKNLQVI